MSRFRYFLAASALLLAAVPARADMPSGRVVVLALCISEQSPERVEALLTNPVEKLLLGLPGVDTVSSITGHGGARFDIRFKGGAGEDDAAAVAQALDRSEAGRAAAFLSRSVQLGQPLAEGQAFGDAVCASKRR